ncbi:isoquinoline 1-oxidoreductase alpha subunit [Roseivirga ehrenbergii]|uniref:(2Fe-2S)-binding protein n=1 Tax=Roseivirga ehrenbergii (strain DSM 102268 / JCM 13514 / KCTC 12282 / NCIMB 14502 / KMM 6017) TaxID=279360 RepID=A0A150WZ01_ROSEK|nr:(2Fe-2S)-binding protein [Roseivirga ehrenbergii]KYG71711.1 (2Fe-2S)-binding protein [Roseivirga ehrenbergii]TCL07596.1 isoquinoline 1-oxidoreductase alpha subunit [Roseivirga ehrenbergii]
MKINVNGIDHEVDVEPNMPLLWVLRDELNLTGTKYGCGVAACGACTVHLDGQAVRSCVLPVAALQGKAITTIESIAKDNRLSRVQQAWIDHQVPQCGYCQSGMIMAVESLLNNNSQPTEEEIDASISNICRCGTYQRIKEAIKEVLTQNQENG